MYYAGSYSYHTKWIKVWYLFVLTTMTMTSKALKKLGQMTNINSICHPTLYLAWSGVGSKTTDFPGLQNGVVIVSQSVSVQIAKQSQLWVATIKGTGRSVNSRLVDWAQPTIYPHPVMSGQSQLLAAPQCSAVLMFPCLFLRKKDEKRKEFSQCLGL